MSRESRKQFINSKEKETICLIKKYQELKFAKITLGKVKLDKPVVFKLGKNYQILAENNLTLIFDEEAMEELLKDIKYLKRTLVKKRTDLQNKT